MIFRRIKWLYQRMKYGASDYDIFDFDHYLTTLISYGLKKILDSSGFGSHIHGDDDCSKMRKIYEDIIFTFETERKSIEMDVMLPEQGQKYDDFVTEYKRIDEYKPTKEEIAFWNKNDFKFCDILISKEDYKRYLRGWKYFKQYFECFWT
uniref:Uncharacterized protein n=2 Tax=viral metagenome TaxID=1070528 RepID=A0A6H1ZD11_9ZZZZ